MADEEYAKKAKLEETHVITEGKAEILVTDKNVFYNPVQEFNRDLSILALYECLSKETDNGKTILDALSATGLRSIRYAKELKGVRQIIANDISAKAVDSIRQNVIHNGVEHLVKPCQEDAMLLMYKHRQQQDRFDVIDLDPYGCPSKYLDAAVQSIADGGLLMVTATDMAVLAGNAPETCYYKYGAVPIKSKCCHEIALRILLHCIASCAARYGRIISPMLSVSVDFYIRVFVQVTHLPWACKQNVRTTGMMYQCTGCESMRFQTLMVRKRDDKLFLPPVMMDQLCNHCQHRQHMAGPIWLGRLHDEDYVERLLYYLSGMKLGTKKRIEGVLNMIVEELDAPLYYNLDRLMSIVKCQVPPMLVFRSALLNAGYHVSYSHTNKNSIKTDAPNDVIWDIVRALEKEHPVKREKLSKNSPAYHILNASSTMNISFTINDAANPQSRRFRMSRFQQNPTANWGPGTRSRIMIDNKADNSKKIKNQNKKSKKKSTNTKICDNEHKELSVMNTLDIVDDTSGQESCEQL